MKTKKLTAKQQELLDAVNRGVVLRYMRYMGRFNPSAYYFRSDTLNRCTSTAAALYERGLVARVNENEFGDHKLVKKESP